MAETTAIFENIPFLSVIPDIPAYYAATRGFSFVIDLTLLCLVFAELMKIGADRAKLSKKHGTIVGLVFGAALTFALHGAGYNLLQYWFTGLLAALVAATAAYNYAKPYWGAWRALGFAIFTALIIMALAVKGAFGDAMKPWISLFIMIGILALLFAILSGMLTEARGEEGEAPAGEQPQGGTPPQGQPSQPTAPQPSGGGAGAQPQQGAPAQPGGQPTQQAQPTAPKEATTEDVKKIALATAVIATHAEKAAQRIAASLAQHPLGEDAAIFAKESHDFVEHAKEYAFRCRAETEMHRVLDQFSLTVHYAICASERTKNVAKIAIELMKAMPDARSDADACEAVLREVVGRLERAAEAISSLRNRASKPWQPQSAFIKLLQSARDLEQATKYLVEIATKAEAHPAPAPVSS